MGSEEPESSGTSSIPSSIDYLVLADAHETSLSIRKLLIADLWAHANHGLRALAHGGLEVGGLLVGPKVCDEKVVIEDVIPLTTEYQYGPAFQMSEADLANLAAAIESVQEQAEKVVLGFFRTRTRGEGTLRESDFEVFKAIEQAHSSFAEDFRCCFILAPVSESTALACIAMRFGAGWWEVPVRTLQADPLSVTVHQTPAAENPEQPPAAGVEEPRKAGSWSYAAAAVFALGIAIGAYHFLTKQGFAKEGIAKESGPEGKITDQAVTRSPSIVPVANTAPSSYLKFSATPSGSDWKLTWDRAAIDALNPDGAVLTIQDGGYPRQVPLSRAELASGILYYTPRSSDLSFGLRIDGRDVEEHLRVLEAPVLTQGPPPQVRIDAQAAAATKSRLAKIMAAHAAAAAANPDAEHGGPVPSPNEGDVRSNP